MNSRAASFNCEPQTIGANADGLVRILKLHTLHPAKNCMTKECLLYPPPHTHTLPPPLHLLLCLQNAQSPGRVVQA
jgi:hypothetical protein